MRPWLVLAAAGAVAAAPAAGSKPNAFMGHYGYLIEFPAEFDATPVFTGPERAVEGVLFRPKHESCGDPGPECMRANAFELSVFPKKLLAKHHRVDSLSAFVAKSQGTLSGPRISPDAAGALKGFKLSAAKPAPSGCDTFVFLEGSKAYYRFAYLAGNPRVRRAMGSLAEIQPHDEPPR